MSETTPDATDDQERAREAVVNVSKVWWISLIAGICWFIIGIVILQFDIASVQTIGLLVGLMFLFTGIQEFIISSAVEGWKWLWIVFGVLFVLAGIYAIINPGATAVALASVLGFLFLLVAIFWIIEAFATREQNDLWWLGLISGIIMFVLAVWVSRQFLIEKVEVLIVFAGVWALMQGLVSVIRGFQIRKLGKLAAGT